MKRKGTAPDEEQDKKKPAVGIAARTRSATRAARFKLTDFADEILIQVYSFLCFKERQTTRRACRRLLEFVDKSTPGANELSIVFGRNPRVSRRSISQSGTFDSISMQSWVSEKVFLRLETARQPRQGDYTIAKLRTSLPPLRSIRPKKLRLQINHTFEVRGFLSVLLQFLAEQQVARSVSSIDLRHDAPLGPEPELRQACSTFDLASQSGVQCLTLRGRTQSLLSLPSYLPGLVSLSLDLEHNREEETTRQLRLLSHHTTLRELCIGPAHNAGVQVVMLTTLAAFSTLQKLDISFYCYQNNEELFNTFAIMIRGMAKLESLRIRTLHIPSIQFWEYLGDKNIISSSLQDLEIEGNLPHDTVVDKLDAMARGVQSFAPSLTTLLLYNSIVKLCSFGGTEDTIRALAPLRHHPTLSKLQFRPEVRAMKKSEGKALMLRLQRELGNTVRAVVSERRRESWSF